MKEKPDLKGLLVLIAVNLPVKTRKRTPECANTHKISVARQSLPTFSQYDCRSNVYERY